MIKRILNSRSNTITFSAVLIAFSVGMSALLGLLRDRLLAANFGAGVDLDIYFAAFRIPDFVYGVLIMGGIVAAFLPVFADTLERDKEDGWKLANNTLNVLCLVLVFLGTVLFIFAPVIVRFIAPGFTGEEREFMALLTRIMMVSPVLLGISSLFSGILQYFDRFLAYSLAPVLYNVGIIFGILFLAPLFDPEKALMGVALGVVVGSVMHFIIQIFPAYFSGFSYKWIIDLKQKELKRIFYLIIPRFIGQFATQINLVVITALGSMLAAGSISVFYFAEHLQAFPVRVVGVAFAVAAFPSFSRSFALKNKEMFLEHFSMVVRQVLFLIIPISVFVFLLRAHIVRLVLGTGEFGWGATQLTAASLGIFSFSFFATALVHVLVRAFFSFQDTRTPVIASVIAMTFNIILSFLFIWALGFDNLFRAFFVDILHLKELLPHIEVIAFPLAILISTALHFFLLMCFLRKKMGFLREREIMESFLKIIASSFLAGVFVFASLRITGTLLEVNTFLDIFTQILIAFITGCLIYVLSSKLLDSPELSGVIGSFSKR